MNMTIHDDPVAVTVPASLAGKRVAVLGGTGPQGRGLARRFALAGLEVVIGSRDGERAVAMAEELTAEIGGPVGGGENAAVAAGADIVLLVVPWDGHARLVKELAHVLAGKVVVDCVNPLSFGKHGCSPILVEEGSAVEQAQMLLPDSVVVGAFNTISAVLLNDPEQGRIDTDVLVVGDVREATDLVQDLAATIPGVRGIFAGRQFNAHQVEAFTANLISMNRRYKAHAGIRVTDI
ncbi:NADPH-dependent F420 reductase [Nocardioides sp. BP30]|uniref:NADPH-dependent F420 reductase n=1 Tax=Nocardioides sp. BP30 TaxID=3036374 RepID=UPI0024695010|nr:NADPH-dependent F420 reductase [Nocardioides sp. BP30]WGL53998.1 NADPH-dependent F420 reductase [Nocardioides sp. BP30]